MSLTRQQMLRYASLGIPLGFMGLPLYMHLPHYYAQAFGMSLSSLGAVFLISRLVDCLLDPLLGRMLDKQSNTVRQMVRAGAFLSAAGMLCLFALPSMLQHAPSLWLVGGVLIVTYLGYSILSIRFYASGVALAPTPQAAALLSSWREGMLIVGIIMAATAPSLGLSYSALAVLFGLLLLATLWLGKRVAPPTPPPSAEHQPLRYILRRHGGLYLVFFCNALAPAITATLYLFYVEEVLVAANLSGVYLLVYFLAAMLAMPVWVKLAARYQKIPCLIVSMCIAIVSFIGASQLQAGDASLFLVICIVTGVAFGADASLLPSLLSDALTKTTTSEHAAFGIWMGISKLTLALAAGLALPAIDLLQTIAVPREDAIRMTYGLLPCAIKAIALLCLIAYQRTQPRSFP